MVFSNSFPKLLKHKVLFYRGNVYKCPIELYITNEFVHIMSNTWDFVLWDFYTYNCKYKKPFIDQTLSFVHGIGRIWNKYTIAIHFDNDIDTLTWNPDIKLELRTRRPISHSLGIDFQLLFHYVIWVSLSIQ